MRHKRVFRRTQLLTCASLVLAAFLATSVWSVCFQPAPRVCTEFYDSTAVFTGKVVSVRDQIFSEGGAPGGWFYRIWVERSFRGPSGPFIEVYTENSSARFPLEKGHRYLLFAQRYEGVLTLTCCGNSGFLENSTSAIKQIEQILNTKSGGEVAGRIGRDDSSEFAGVRIIVEGERGSFEGVTDSRSWFHIKVPEGRYRVRAKGPGHIYVPYDLTYDDPGHIVVHAGGCPQVEFAPEEWYHPVPAPQKPR